MNDRTVGLALAGLVLAGGRSRRLGGVDKAGLEIDSRTLLERTLDALGNTAPLVVVGPGRPVSRDVVWTLEDPPDGGPLAGIRAGLTLVPEDVPLVTVLATDHPHLTRSTVARLVQAVSADSGRAGAVLTDGTGAPQWLVGVWRADALRRAIPADARDVAVRAVVADLAPALIPSIGAEACDVDTPEDLRRSRQD